MKKKREKPEDFIGWKSNNGLLEVIDIHGTHGNKTIYKVVCNKCKEDKELFPLGYFVSRKDSLISGQIPCGCSKCHKWNQEQFLILVRRAGKDRFIVHDFAEEFHGAQTKLNLECLKDGYEWAASVNSIRNGRGCHKCKGKTSGDAKRADLRDVFEKCKTICKSEGYEPIGFIKGYKNCYSHFEYKCPIHGIQNVSYNDFVHNGSRCKYCWKERQKEILRDSGNGNGYFPERKDEQDFLYALNFNNEYIKVGRSFNVERRVSKNQLQKESGISSIVKLRIFTATHKEIYDLEQELHSELRERNFQYYVDWSSECFENDCLFILNKLLDICGLQELPIE